MASATTFGRRVNPQSVPIVGGGSGSPGSPEIAEPARQFEALPDCATPPSYENAVSVDNELREWKKSRRFPVPWYQLSLMASLSFGIGSLVLPDSVNSAVQWLLYGLTAASFYVWFTSRRKKAKS